MTTHQDPNIDTVKQTAVIENIGNSFSGEKGYWPKGTHTHTFRSQPKALPPPPPQSPPPPLIHCLPQANMCKGLKSRDSAALPSSDIFQCFSMFSMFFMVSCAVALVVLVLGGLVWGVDGWVSGWVGGRGTWVGGRGGRLGGVRG